MHPRQGHDGEQQALGCKAKENQAPQRSVQTQAAEQRTPPACSEGGGVLRQFQR